MNDEELASHLGTIARSGTKTFLNNLSGDAKRDSNLIGQFGVDFTASSCCRPRNRLFPGEPVRNAPGAGPATARAVMRSNPPSAPHRAPCHPYFNEAGKE